MKKLILTVAVATMGFLSHAQWKNDQEFVKHNALFKRKSFNSRSDALAEASKMWGYLGYRADLDYMYQDEDVLCLGHFIKDGRVYGMIVTRFGKSRYDVMICEHEDEDTDYFKVGNVLYGYYKD